MIIVMELESGDRSKIKCVPNTGSDFTKKDVRNLERWVALLNKQSDVLYAKLLTKQEYRKFHLNRFMEDIKSGRINVPKMFSETKMDIDEDYHIKCLNCGRIVYAGKCCDNYQSQAMKDKEN